MLKSKGKLVRGAIATAMLALPCIALSAETADFSTNGSLGKTGSAVSVDAATGVEARGWYLVGGTTWTAAQLFRRNDDPADHGIGVCNPVEEANVGINDPNCGGGNVNELDNIAEPEIITLKLPDNYHWVSVQVSSMDSNDDLPVPERGILYGNDDAVFGTTQGAIGDKVLEEIEGDDVNREQTISIGPGDSHFPYLIFEPFDYVGQGSNNDNDFLVFKAVIERDPPEEIDGRMTGGGSVFGDGRMRVTHGFEIHCNLAEPNRIQVNWPDHRFHLLSLDNAVCIENADIIQLPRRAPFDTFEGMGTGRLNGVPGAKIDFTFIDGGEPGKTNDTAHIIIWDKDGAKVLEVDGKLNNGNHQAHPNNKPAP